MKASARILVLGIAAGMSLSPTPADARDTTRRPTETTSATESCIDLPICAVDAHCESGICYRPEAVDGFAEKGVCVETCLIQACGEGLTCVEDLFTAPDTSYVCAPSDACVEQADICKEAFDCAADDECLEMGFEACFREYTVDGLAPTGVCVASAMTTCLPQHTVQELPGSAPDVAYVCVPPAECTDVPLNSPFEDFAPEIIADIPNDAWGATDEPVKASPRNINLPGYIPMGDCGDGKVNGGESCDGNDLNGKGCKSWNLVGTLSCTASCKFDFSNCLTLGKSDFFPY